MALDQAYFDALRIEVVKKKYYDADRVEAVLGDIRRQALEQDEENRRLRKELAALVSRREEIGEAILAAKTVARQIIAEAQAQADAIVTGAEERSRELVADAEQEARVRQTEACYSRVRERLQSCLEELNADWQDYLCALEDEPAAPPPADLDEKVGAIAREVFAIDGEEEGAAESVQS